MRIISKFHDYYDNLINLFQSEVTPIYKRKTVKIKTEIHAYTLNLRTNGFTIRNGESEISYCDPTKLIIGFCGELYLCYCYIREKDHKGHGIDSYSKNYEFVYTPERMFEIQEMFKKDDPTQKHYKHCNSYHTLSEWKECFKDVANNNEIKKLFLEHKVPAFKIENFHIAHMDKTILTLNPCLDFVGFVKVKDHYSAIQEIHQYLNNVLVEDSGLPINITNDKVIQQAKGLDGKYSFKTPPGKKKRKKK